MSEHNPKNRRRARRAGILICILVAAVAALAGGGYYVWDHYFREPQGYAPYQFDTAAMAGRIQNMTEAEIQAEMDHVIEDGMFNISIASAIVFETPTAQGQARIENIAANRYHMQVDILLDETGETVYSSQLIQPGYSIEYITLNRELEPGEYPATAVFSAITQEELQLFGTAAAQITLYVFDGEATPSPSPAPSASPQA